MSLRNVRFRYEEPMSVRCGLFKPPKCKTARLMNRFVLSVTVLTVEAELDSPYTEWNAAL